MVVDDLVVLEWSQPVLHCMRVTGEDHYYLYLGPEISKMQGIALAGTFYKIKGTWREWEGDGFQPFGTRGRLLSYTSRGLVTWASV